MGENTTRFLSGVIFTGLLVSTLFLSKLSFLIVVAVFGIICLMEFSKLRLFKSIVIYPTLIFLIYILHFLKPDELLVPIMLSTTILVALILMIHLFLLKEMKINLINNYLLSVFYIISGIAFITLIPTVKGSFNPLIMLAIFVIMWSNDTFAYLVGKQFGKRKLYEKISPKKTIEGFLGGLIFALISAFILTLFNSDFDIKHWLVIAIIIVIFGSIGDLIQSQLKRQANVKDSGQILPGHGGMYDRLDSLLFAAPFIYSYLFLIQHHVS